MLLVLFMSVLKVGINCVIHSVAAISAEGFVFFPTFSRWLKIKQFGLIILEDHVEVGCNIRIDRPAVGKTRIGHNTKIDNLVQVGDGCKIVGSCAIAAQSGIAGGVNRRNRVILAGHSGIGNQAKICDGATTTAKAGVHSGISSGELLCGSPAMPSYKRYLKVFAILNRLPETYQAVRKLQRNSCIF